LSILGDVIKYSRLAFELRGFLKTPISLEQSKLVISQRLQDREKNFLNLSQKGIYNNSHSPYLPLLENAGCLYGDLEHMVSRDGLESTLQKLLKDGVYLSWEEFKGKREIVRGNKHFQFQEEDFDNPYLPNYYQVRSSGSRSKGTRTSFDLTYMLEKSYYRLPLMHAFGVEDFPLGMYFPILPSSAGLAVILQMMKAGKNTSKWFSPVDERQVQALWRDRIALRYFVYGARLWGAKIPWPEYVGFEDVVKIAQWIAETKKRFGGCNFACFVSLAVMVCQAAIEHGLDIQGSHFVLGGEPLTQGKRQQISAAGVTMSSTYFITEIGWIGSSCPNIDSSDDMHLYVDSVAMILRHRKVENIDLEVDAFAYTTLLASAPKILINLESDDYGIYETKKCGCLFEQLGLVHHISNVRSFAKLTGRGMTIVGSDFVYILENVLPQKFGGAATDYQLVEEEDSRSQTRLILIISPKLGNIDEKVLIDTILHELRNGIYGGKLASGLWSQTEALQIRRSNPISNSGKVMPLHLITKQN
jgi:hypothetical protein